MGLLNGVHNPTKGSMELTSQHTLLNLKTNLVLFLWLKISFILWPEDFIEYMFLTYFLITENHFNSGERGRGTLYLHLCDHITQLMLPLNGSSPLKSQFHQCLHSSPGYVCL